MSDTNASVKISIGDSTYSYPVIEGSEGEMGFLISKLRKDTGHITLDPGYTSTGACQSAITFLDGEKGILRHRGYAIEELAEEARFLEVTWLLLYGELPTAAELEEFTEQVRSEYALPTEIIEMVKKFPRHGHPMAVLSSATIALSGLYDGGDEAEATPEAFRASCARLMGKFLAIAALTYRLHHGKEYLEPGAEHSYCENLVHMMFGDSGMEDDLLDLKALVINRLLVVHADHEQNCSTSTVRLVSSSGASSYAAVAAGVNALWGPLHGGANQAVMDMLEQIAADGGDIEETLARAKDKSDPFRLMGFGHRVYKTYDPRAKIAKKSCFELLERLKIDEPLIDIAVQLEKAALADPYFQKRNLFPNVDFYTGLIYRALKIPSEMFTVLFAIGRLPGWLAHIRELENDPDRRIGRPRQIYTGPNLRPFTPLEGR